MGVSPVPPWPESCLSLTGQGTVGPRLAGLHPDLGLVDRESQVCETERHVPVVPVMMSH